MIKWLFILLLFPVYAYGLDTVFCRLGIEDTYIQEPSAYNHEGENYIRLSTVNDSNAVGIFRFTGIVDSIPAWNKVVMVKLGVVTDSLRGSACKLQTQKICKARTNFSQVTWWYWATSKSWNHIGCLDSGDCAFSENDGDNAGLDVNNTWSYLSGNVTSTLQYYWTEIDMGYIDQKYAASDSLLIKLSLIGDAGSLVKFRSSEYGGVGSDPKLMIIYDTIIAPKYTSLLHSNTQPGGLKHSPRFSMLHGGGTGPDTLIDTTTFSGATFVEDCWIFYDHNTTSYNNDTLYVGQGFGNFGVARTLIRLKNFTDSIPKTAYAIAAGTLSLWCHWNSNGNVLAYKCCKPWQEGDATFNRWDHSASKEWGTAGAGSGTAGSHSACYNATDAGGNDFYGTAWSAIGVTVNTWIKFPIDSQVVDYWIQHTDSLEGLILKQSGDMKYSRFHSTAWDSVPEFKIIWKSTQ